MKKSYQHRKESKDLNEIIIHLQAHIRGYLIRKEIKSKIQWCNIQELHVIKIQVSFFYYSLYNMLVYLINYFRNGGDVFYLEENGQFC